MRRERKARKLTLQELAELSGVSYQYLSQIERGEKMPRPEALTRIRDALGLSAAVPDPKPPERVDVDNRRAAMGACLLVAGEDGIELHQLARDFGMSTSEVRAELRQLDAAALAIGVTVIDDGYRASLATTAAHAATVRATMARRQARELTPGQHEVLTMVIMLETATSTEIREIRGADSHDQLERLTELGLLDRQTLEHEPGKPRRYQPTPRTLERFGYRTFEDLREDIVRRSGYTPEEWAAWRERLLPAGFRASEKTIA